MKLHPRIQELSKIIEEQDSEMLLSIETLKKLLAYGATATEAAITLHLAFNVSDEKASEFVLNSNLFPIEEINDTAYQTLTYLYYDPSID